MNKEEAKKLLELHRVINDSHFFLDCIARDILKKKTDNYDVLKRILSVVHDLEMEEMKLDPIIRELSEKGMFN